MTTVKLPACKLSCVTSSRVHNVVGMRRLKCHVFMAVLHHQLSVALLLVALWLMLIFMQINEMEDVVRQSQGYASTLQNYNTSLQADVQVSHSQASEQAAAISNYIKCRCLSMASIINCQSHCCYSVWKRGDAECPECKKHLLRSVACR